MQKDLDPKASESPALSSKAELKPEREHVGSIWKHPYMIYIVLTVALALLLVGLTYVASENGLIPSR